jgi:two-component system NtrC family sensor kinase
LLSKWPIRVKLLIGLALLSLLVVILASSGLYATYAYRGLAKSLSARVVELPVAAELSRRVGDLRITLSELRGLRANTFASVDPGQVPLRVRMVGDRFRSGLGDVEETIDDYRNQLEEKRLAGSPIRDNQREWQTVHKIEAALDRVHTANCGADWMLDDVKVGQLDAELEHLQMLAGELPSHLHHKLAGLAAEVRGQYRALIVGTWVTSVTAGLIFALFVKLFYQWIFVPLRVLVAGSREVASGRFSYRIHLQTHDEMAELADAMNQMTARFEAIRNDLDGQVRERTKQVVRNEQLASVGFLAAGVAHEINNPLASIALCAESLEERVGELLNPADRDHGVIANYLKMIQSEAFRCKEITEKLLDFSRMGPAVRQDTDLAELVQGVIDMVGHLGKYQRRNIRFAPEEPVRAPINAQQLKQVVLNLLTNALDSLDAGGTVCIELSQRDGMADLVFADDGCGMTQDVLEHVFEPFFTRKRLGQGTGLGLSITCRIVADHGGDIEAHSDGPGRGSTFRVRLPLASRQKEADHRNQAA